MIPARQTNSQENSLPVSLSSSERSGLRVAKTFGNSDSFMVKVNPDHQMFFGTRQELAVMGDYPRLCDLDAAYGNGFSIEWLIPQIGSLVIFTGARNLTAIQQEELARIIASSEHSDKILAALPLILPNRSTQPGQKGGCQE